MIKKAYKKLFSYPRWWLSVAGILFTSLLYHVRFLFRDELTERSLGWICLGSGGLYVFFLLSYTIHYVIQVQKASHYLHSLPSHMQERLEHDLEIEDRLDDMYFTSDFLLVYQFQFTKKQGFSCIPYTEIEKVRISPNCGNGNFLEILSPEGTVSHRVWFSQALNARQVTGINQKILSLKTGARSVRTTADEQAERDRAAKRNLKKSLRGVPMLISDFAAIMAFCASMGVAEHYREKVELLKRSHALQFTEEAYTYGNGTLLFWPNLQFYVVMYGSMLLLIGSILFAMKIFCSEEYTFFERVINGRILLFTIVMILFILFTGSMYTSDVHTWENMVQGFHLLT